MLAGVIALSLLSPATYALSVGNMQVDSRLGEPLDISIDINSIDQDEFSTLDVSLASREMFSEAGIEYPGNARYLHLELGPYEDGRATISVKTAGAVSDPFVHLLLKISWSGGNMLREYTALIDPADYNVEPIVQAAAPATSLGTTRAMTEQENAPAKEIFRPVESGDTLSAIAALYRPSDVSIQQAWMAFYNLNRDAFPDRNLNKLEKGARLKIPDDAQMKTMSREDAIREVRKLSRPLAGEQPRKASVSAPTKNAATLTVGGVGNTAQAGGANAQTGGTAATTAESIALSDLQGYDQLASIVTELGSFTQTIKQEISDSRGRDALLKEELIAARGENRVLTGRMGRLEEQISKMGQLLELQSNALQALNSNMEDSRKAPASGLSLNQLEPVEAIAAPKQVTEAPAAVPTTQSASGDAAPKTYYEQLLEVAISDAPEEDVSYIEEVLGLSSTSIGQTDTNPVTPEMQAKAAASKPALPAGTADQATATMLANVRASLGNIPATPGGVPKTEVKIGSQDSEYIDALNQEDRSQIEKSEARIAQLQQQLQAKIDAAKQPATVPATAPPASPEAAKSTPKKPAATTTATAGDDGNDAETGVLSSVMDLASTAVSAVMSVVSGLSQDTWRLVGGVGAAIIGLMVMLGLRRRKEGGGKKASNESTGASSGDSAPDVAAIATQSMLHEPDEDEDLEEELHGSSLFDLSDESFMASEAIQDDSSLFSMDDNENFDSLTDMDSAQFGQQSAAAQTVDVDPVAEADVYLAYDRKEQAIEVLEQALASDPNQSPVVIKLLGLFQANENIEGFTRLFESSAEHIEDDADWNKIKMMAQDFVPGHEMLADDFDSSIPVLMDEVVDTGSKKAGTPDETEDDTDTLPVVELSMGSDSEDLDNLLDDEIGLGELENLNLGSEDEEPSIDEESVDESLNISLDSDDGLTLDESFDSTTQEVNQHEPDTALALAKAYIELGEEDIAKDFLLDVINAGSAELKSEAEEMLASLG